jgi:hypothetical protein
MTPSRPPLVRTPARPAVADAAASAKADEGTSEPADNEDYVDSAEIPVIREPV